MPLPPIHLQNSFENTSLSTLREIDHLLFFCLQAMTAATLAAIAPATEDNLLHLDLTKTASSMAAAMAASMPATAAVGRDAAIQLQLV